MGSSEDEPSFKVTDKRGHGRPVPPSSTPRSPGRPQPLAQRAAPGPTELEAAMKDVQDRESAWARTQASQHQRQTALYADFIRLVQDAQVPPVPVFAMSCRARWSGTWLTPVRTYDVVPLGLDVWVVASQWRERSAARLVALTTDGRTLEVLRHAIPDAGLSSRSGIDRHRVRRTPRARRVAEMGDGVAYVSGVDPRFDVETLSRDELAEAAIRLTQARTPFP